MPRLTCSVPKYRHHKRSGQAVVTLSGRDVYLGPWKSQVSRDEYDRRIKEWLERGRSLKPAETFQGRESKAVVEIIAAYLRHAAEYYRKHGRETREVACIRDACKVLKRLYGREDADSFGPIALQAVRRAMIELDWSRPYVNRQVGRLVRMFKWATSQELVKPGIVEGLRSLSGLRRGRTHARETDPVLPIDDATVEKTLEKLPQVVADMVRVQRLTGARPAEVCQLRPLDVDRSDPEVWYYVPSTHKTEHHERTRTICIGPRAQEILLPYLLRPAELHCFSPLDSERKRRARQHAARKTPLSCGNRPGTNRKASRKRPPRQQYDVNSYRRAIHRACDLAKIPRWSPNRLRHSAATEIRKQFGLEGAQCVLGHSSADITQVYAERDLALAARVAKTVG